MEFIVEIIADPEMSNRDKLDAIQEYIESGDKN